MSRAIGVAFVSIWLGLASGCGVVQCKVCAQKFGEQPASARVEPSVEQRETRVVNSAPVIISVTGFGAPEVQMGNKEQRMLMAMRASEVDAYRRLAERVKGVQISGSTKVIDFVTNNDHLRAVVDAFVRNARVISQGMTGEGIYETTLSLTLDGDFFYQFPSVGADDVTSTGIHSSYPRDTTEVVANVTDADATSKGRFDFGATLPRVVRY